jgi:hypothetical protein
MIIKISAKVNEIILITKSKYKNVGIMQQIE